MKNGKVFCVLICFATLVLFGAGCSKLTKQNYDKVKIGMEYEEVTALLGDGPICDGAMGAKSCTWGDEQKNITVKFVADKVIFITCKGI